MVNLTIRGMGTIKIVTFTKEVPVTANNFEDLANSGFYNGLTFHRVINGFMIQGGCPYGTGVGGADNQIKGEFSANGFDNPVSHTRGVVSMARSNDFDGASSQFFIVHKDSTFLDGNYAAFGVVVSGIDVVDRIASTQKDANDKPFDPIVIERAWVS
ncbi:MAG: peptidylprolyl isomerase [Eubacteriaceae bacterium]|nr:peptidylprolyl isomerase [Eubacteriaceae bacterium]